MIAILSVAVEPTQLMIWICEVDRLYRATDNAPADAAVIVALGMFAVHSA